MEFSAFRAAVLQARAKQNGLGDVVRFPGVVEMPKKSPKADSGSFNRFTYPADPLWFQIGALVCWLVFIALTH